MLMENETRIEETALKCILANSMEIIVYLRHFSVHEIIGVKGYHKIRKTYEYEVLYRKEG
jgi:hypothetical protein